MTVPCPFCGALHFIQERLTLSSQTNPVFGSCCLSGKISLPASVAPPEPLRALLDDLTPQAKEFRNHARAYNAALQMASSGIKVDERFSTGDALFPGVICWSVIYTVIHHQAWDRCLSSILLTC